MTRILVTMQSSHTFMALRLAKSCYANFTDSKIIAAAVKSLQEMSDAQIHIVILLSTFTLTQNLQQKRLVVSAQFHGEFCYPYPGHEKTVSKILEVLKHVAWRARYIADAVDNFELEYTRLQHPVNQAQISQLEGNSPSTSGSSTTTVVEDVSSIIEEADDDPPDSIGWNLGNHATQKWRAPSPLLSDFSGTMTSILRTESSENHPYIVDP
ncbi:hypothetical protein BT69DRAFT_683267 [Atractiella rhizophila]|nr:hypothetical protein BT69DRAFT_683267 [Atractiella rhizophila]